MRFIIRMAVLVALLYSVATASTEQKSAMFQGLRALGGSVQDACLRARPCERVVDSALDLVRQRGPQREMTSELGSDGRPVPLFERSERTDPYSLR